MCKSFKNRLMSSLCHWKPCEQSLYVFNAEAENTTFDIQVSSSVPWSLDLYGSTWESSKQQLKSPDVFVSETKCAILSCQAVTPNGCTRSRGLSGAYHQPKQRTTICFFREIPQNYYRFVLFDSPLIGCPLMTPAFVKGKITERDLPWFVNLPPDPLWLHLAKSSLMAGRNPCCSHHPSNLIQNVSNTVWVNVPPKKTLQKYFETQKWWCFYSNG